MLVSAQRKPWTSAIKSRPPKSSNHKGASHQKNNGPTQKAHRQVLAKEGTARNRAAKTLTLHMSARVTCRTAVGSKRKAAVQHTRRQEYDLRREQSMPHGILEPRAKQEKWKTKKKKYLRLERAARIKTWSQKTSHAFLQDMHIFGAWRKCHDAGESDP